MCVELYDISQRQRGKSRGHSPPVTIALTSYSGSFLLGLDHLCQGLLIPSKDGDMVLTEMFIELDERATLIQFRVAHRIKILHSESQALKNIR